VYSYWRTATNATRAAVTAVTAYDATAERVGLEVEAFGTGSYTTSYGGQIRPYVAKTADYTLTRGDYVCDVTANNVSITLPTAVGAQGQIFFIKNSGSGTVTLIGTIDGSTINTLSQWEVITVISDNANWKVL
jgi:hypothetical protein